MTGAPSAVVDAAFLVAFPIAASIVGSIIAVLRPPGPKTTSAVQHFAAGVVMAALAGEVLPDLKGKRIGYARGSTAHYGLIMTLRQQGIGVDQVTLVDMPPVEQLAALENGTIDAAISWEPWLHRMTHEAGARVIATEGDLGIYTNVTGYAVRRDWLSANRETAVRFMRALLMAYDVLKKDRDVGIKARAKEMGMKETWVKEIYDDAPPPNMNWWKDHRYRYSLVQGAGLHRRLGYLATFLLEGKIVSQPVDVSEVMDVSIITEVLSTLKSQPPTAPAQ